MVLCSQSDQNIFHLHHKHTVHRQMTFRLSTTWRTLGYLYLCELTFGEVKVPNVPNNVIQSSTTCDPVVVMEPSLPLLLSL